MKKTKQEPAPETVRPALEPETNGHARSQDGKDDSAPASDAAANDVLGEATRWVQQNQTVALVGAFGIGVFIGVLLRR